VTDLDPTTTDDRAATAQAWVVTLTILALLVATVVVFAFSQQNTPASIDGRTATTSQFFDAE
jgi:hypothetical protein